MGKIDYFTGPDHSPFCRFRSGPLCTIGAHIHTAVDNLPGGKADQSVSVPCDLPNCGDGSQGGEICPQINLFDSQLDSPSTPPPFVI